MKIRILCVSLVFVFLSGCGAVGPLIAGGASVGAASANLFATISKCQQIKNQAQEEGWPDVKRQERLKLYNCV